MLYLLRQAPLEQKTRVSRWGTRWAWTVSALNCMALVWLLSIGQWLDDQHNVLSIASWNGHHRVLVLIIAAALLILAVMAPLTRGFSEGTQAQINVVVAASFISVVALAGFFALLIPLVVLGLAVGALGRWLD